MSEHRDGARLVVAARRDGLGGRLCALLNTIRTAEALGWNYSFIWPRMYNSDTQFHAVDDPKLTFTANYLEEHFLRVFNPQGFVLVEDDTLQRDIPACLKDSSSRGIALYHWPSEVKLPQLDGPALHQCIEKIGFHPQVVAVRKRIEDLNLAEHCAIHVRRGDIVYGNNRHNIYNDKYVPLGILKRVIEYHIDIGSKVLLVSEETELCDYLKKRYGIRVGAELSTGADFTPIEQAFFDIFSISACQRVLGRSSAFSVSAALIGGIGYTDIVETFHKICTAEAIQNDLRDHAADYHSLQVAKEHYYVADLRILPPERREEQMLRAMEADPDNYTYVRFYANDLARQKRFEDLETLLRRASESSFEKAGRDTIHFLPIFRRYNQKKELRLAKRSADRSPTPYILGYYSYLLEKANKTLDALSYAQQAHDKRPDSQLLFLRLMHLLLANKKKRKALRSLQEHQSDCADSPYYYVLRGEARAAIKRAREAADDYVEAFRLAPTNFHYAARAANYYYVAGMEAEAAEFMQLALAGGGDQPTVRYWQSKLAEKQGDYHTAVKAMELAHQLRPDKSNYLDRLEAMRDKRDAASEKQLEV